MIQSRRRSPEVYVFFLLLLFTFVQTQVQIQVQIQPQSAIIVTYVTKPVWYSMQKRMRQ